MYLTSATYQNNPHGSNPSRPFSRLVLLLAATFHCGTSEEKPSPYLRGTAGNTVHSQLQPIINETASPSKRLPESTGVTSVFEDAEVFTNALEDARRLATTPLSSSEENTPTLKLPAYAYSIVQQVQALNIDPSLKVEVTKENVLRILKNHIQDDGTFESCASITDCEINAKRPDSDEVEYDALSFEFIGCIVPLRKPICILNGEREVHVKEVKYRDEERTSETRLKINFEKTGGMYLYLLIQCTETVSEAIGVHSNELKDKIKLALNEQIAATVKEFKKEGTVIKFEFTGIKDNLKHANFDGWEIHSIKGADRKHENDVHIVSKDHKIKVVNCLATDDDNEIDGSNPDKEVTKGPKSPSGSGDGASAALDKNDVLNIDTPSPNNSDNEVLSVVVPFLIGSVLLSAVISFYIARNNRPSVSSSQTAPRDRPPVDVIEDTTPIAVIEMTYPHSDEGGAGGKSLEAPALPVYNGHLPTPSDPSELERQTEYLEWPLPPSEPPVSLDKGEEAEKSDGLEHDSRPAATVPDSYPSAVPSAPPMSPEEQTKIFQESEAATKIQSMVRGRQPRRELRLRQLEKRMRDLDQRLIRLIENSSSFFVKNQNEFKSEI